MAAARLRLGVNIDHVATLRQLRGTPYPDTVEAARLCVEAGAAGITVHLREDRRHIQDADVYRLRRALRRTRGRGAPACLLNLEMADVAGIVAIALDAGPDEVCIVPERRRELTTEGGLDVVGRLRGLARTVGRLRAAGIRVSLFIDPDPRQIDASAAIGADMVELHTGTYCDASGAGARRELRRLVAGARRAHALGLTVNAGHGINMANLPGILELPHLDTLNIGHSIICRAAFIGLPAAVREMRRGMAAYAGGRP
jgi:pyridoxine 5-phosphate synthase